MALPLWVVLKLLIASYTRTASKKWIDVWTFFVDHVSLYNLVNKGNLVHNFLSMFISFHYTLRATMCPSSGEITVSMRHLVLVTLCGWVSGMQGAPCIPDSHPYRVTNTKCHIDTVISPDDGHSRPKHVAKRNKHTKKIVHQVGFIYKMLQTFVCDIRRT